jgi:hypothetical protein
MTARSFWLLLVLSVAPSRAWCGQQIEVPLLVETCQRAPATLIDTLDGRWQRLRRYVDLCPVRSPEGGIILSVLTVRVDRVNEENLIQQWGIDEPPDPLILDNQGVVVGTLGESFPVDPPGELKVTFTDWQENWPHRIKLFQAGTSALFPHAVPPMVWDDRLRRYVRSPLRQGR